jgi:two-component system sensor histidine kinase KdpD
VTIGRLRVYLGAMPGVGKTHAMVEEGLRRACRGTDVVIGIIDTTGHPGWVGREIPLERLPTTFCPDGNSELDADAVIDRRPRVVLVDDVGHQCEDGHGRWESVDRILDAGIDVICTLDIGDLASLHDTVASITGVESNRIVPDAFIPVDAQIELVDMSPEALRRRLAHGHVYPPERVDAALANLFRPAVLGALRHLALTWLADRVAEQLERDLAPSSVTDRRPARERVLVALGGEGGELLVRRAARLADRSGGEVIGVHVMSPNRHPGPDLEHQRRLLVSLGGTYREIRGDDVAGALGAFARVEQATQIVVGARPTGLRSRSHGEVLDELIDDIGPADVHIVPTGATLARQRRLGSTRPSDHRPRAQVVAGWTLCLVGLPLVTLVLAVVREHVSLGSALLIDLCIVMAVAALAGLRAGLVASVSAFALTNWFLTQPLHTLTISEAENVVALSVFVLVTVVISVLVDRAARQSREASSARADAAALVGALDPLSDLLEQVRATFALDAASVLERVDGAWWPTHTSGSPELLTPEQGTSIDLSAEGDLRLVVSGTTLGSEQLVVLRAFADQLAMAVEARRLRAEAAEADLIAEADALRSSLLQAVSHDFRTPLATIKASASGLLHTDVAFTEDDRRVLLHDIEGAADRLDRMVRDLLDMSRLQAGAVDLVLRSVPLEEVVASALVGVDSAQSRVDVDVAPTLPMVLADSALLERAIANIVSNAIAWSPANRSVRIEAGLVGSFVDLRVVDRGPGVERAYRDRMFVPFQRFGDRSHDAGAGLGLAIAKGFVDAMGASLEVDDTPGGGLTLTVRLPIAEQP